MTTPIGHFVLYLRHATSDEQLGKPIEFDANIEEAVDVARQYVRQHPGTHVEGDLHMSIDGVLENLGTVTR